MSLICDMIEALPIQEALFQAEIVDWRAMVDAVLIDTAYDGEVFDIVSSDVPDNRGGLVEGEYELPAPEGETTVAVKLVDVLGEEVIVTAVV